MIDSTVLGPWPIRDWPQAPLKAPDKGPEAPLKAPDKGPEAPLKAPDKGKAGHDPCCACNVEGPSSLRNSSATRRRHGFKVAAFITTVRQPPAGAAEQHPGSRAGR